MRPEELKRISEAQKSFFKTNQTKSLRFRHTSLSKLRSLILDYQNEISEALFQDLHKSMHESWATEIGLVLSEIRVLKNNLNKWAKTKKVKSPLVLFRSKSYIIPEPYGRVLIMSPWNYPFQLLFLPLAGAIASGNCVVLRPSSSAPHTSKLMKEMIEKAFSEEYIKIIDAPREAVQDIIKQDFDYIFFTGSAPIGKKIMEFAAQQLTPVSLELGGKNPCIVAKDSNLDLAARRIIWGKFVNAGQSCVAPDYLLVQKEVKEKLLEKMKQKIIDFFGTEPSQSKDFTHIINSINTTRLGKLMKGAKIVHGGEVRSDENYVAPTILDNINSDHPSMQEEVFGPILPVLEFDKIEDAIRLVNERPTPLCLYVFSSSSRIQKQVIENTSSGTVAINETKMHFANPYLPFGGKGNSGMGKYHGKSSFETFTHYRSVLHKKNKIDFSLRYPVYNDRNRNILKCFLK